MFISNFIKRKITLLLETLLIEELQHCTKKILSLELAPENEGVYNFTIKNPNFS